jgi:FkbM family methyltransferase
MRTYKNMNNILPIQSKDGHTYWVEEGDKLYIQRLQAGQYQGSNWTFAQTLIDNWTRALDVGTNNACNAIHYAKRFGHVECFEPTPLAQQLWANTVRDSGTQNVTLYKNAVGECQKSTTIVIHDKNGGHNHLLNADRPRWSGKKWTPRIPKPRQRICLPVQVETIDSYNFQDVGFIKIDVEGYEKFVLEGAVDTIARCRPTIQLEIVANQCRKFGYWGEDMIEWIRSMDYTVVSRKRGNLYGKFQSYRTELRYEGVKYKGEMDLWFQPNERVHSAMTKVKTFDILFEQCP